MKLSSFRKDLLLFCICPEPSLTKLKTWVLWMTLVIGTLAKVLDMSCFTLRLKKTLLDQIFISLLLL